MKKEFEDYLRSVGITDALLPRIEFQLKNIETITQESIEQIIVSEYIQEDGSKYYESLRTFTRSLCVNLHNFLQNENYAIWNLARFFSTSDATIMIRVENFDFKTSLPSSRLVFECWRENPEFTITMKTSGHNCKHFVDNIFLKCILPRIIEKS
jgi:hypothetical protein